MQQYPELLFLRNGKLYVAKPQRHWAGCIGQQPGQSATRCSCATLSLPMPGEVPDDTEEPAFQTEEDSTAYHALAQEEERADEEFTASLRASFAHWGWPAAEPGSYMDVDMRTENSFGD